jgi:predicted transcriptional regulator
MKLEYPHKCLNVLGNELRINILASLKEKPKTVSELINELKAEQSKLSHSLQQLRKCNFVDFQKKGKERKYFLKSDILTDGQGSLFELIENHVEKYCKIKK